MKASTIRSLLLATVVVAGTPTSPVSAQWGLRWDVQPGGSSLEEMERDFIHEEIDRALLAASRAFEASGFPAPYVADASCARPDPFPVIDLYDWELRWTERPETGEGSSRPERASWGRGGAWSRWRDEACEDNFDYSHAVAYCDDRTCPRLLVYDRLSLEILAPLRENPVLYAYLSSGAADSDETLGKLRSLLVGAQLFEAVMDGYEWFRVHRPQSETDFDEGPSEPWFVDAMALAAAQAAVHGRYPRMPQFPRAYNFPLHRPLGWAAADTPAPGRASPPDFGVSDFNYDRWETESLLTAQFWDALIGSFGIEALQKSLDGEEIPGISEPYVRRQSFFLDMLDAGLHRTLKELLVDNELTTNVAVADRDLVTALCRPPFGAPLQALTLEERAGPCDAAVGGLHWVYPMMMALQVESYFRGTSPGSAPEMRSISAAGLARMFPDKPARMWAGEVEPARGHPEGCIRRTPSFDAPLSLGIPEVAAECIVLEDLPRADGPLALVWIDGDKLDNLMGLSLGW
ncbi:MAG: hypothetical protein R3190_11860, partial [Thermoanaerobaculia bacterium]|nr:hypothetical protein [Thermoanaerobaculia bacterium]